MINTFEFLVNTAVESLEMIADAEKKATICAQLAQAIALSGALRPEISVESIAPIQEVKEEPKKASKKKTSKKDSLKTENTKVASAPVEETTPVEESAPQAPAVPEEPVSVPEEPVAAAPEVEFVDEWTDAMQEAKAEQLGLLNAYVEAWGEEFVYGDCLTAFSEGAFAGGENVRPSNIDGFVVYLNELAQQNAQ